MYAIAPGNLVMTLSTTAADGSERGASDWPRIFRSTRAMHHLAGHRQHTFVEAIPLRRAQAEVEGDELFPSMTTLSLRNTRFSSVAECVHTQAEPPGSVGLAARMQLAGWI